MNLLNKLYVSVKVELLNRKWRRLNKHNYTNAISIFPFDKVEVGNMTYCDLNIRSWNNHDSHLKIGNYCSIAEGTLFLLSGEHPYTKFSTYPFDTRILKMSESGKVSKGDIVIGDDVWIGMNCIILSGVNIGQGAIIGAGSIVVKDIPPYSIFAGGKIIKKRFPDEIVNKLLMFDFSTLSTSEIAENIDIVHLDVGMPFFETEFYKAHRRLGQ